MQTIREIQTKLVTLSAVDLGRTESRAGTAVELLALITARRITQFQMTGLILVMNRPRQKDIGQTISVGG